jgi:hypothetical protein
MKSVPVEVPDGEGTKIMRKRELEGEIPKGYNEQMSADELIAYMRSPENAGLFTPEDEALALDAIAHTVPDFEGGTAVQRALTEQSSIISRALALADLGDAGMDGFAAYKKQGDGFFREENIDITESIRSGRPLSQGEEDWYRSRMLAWSNFQPIFAEGRKARFDTEVKGLPEEAEKAIRKLFKNEKPSDSEDAANAVPSTFDETIRESRKLAEVDRSRMTFRELAEDMGYIGVTYETIREAA